MKVKLSVYAKQQGISYKTAWEWFNKGLIPNAERLPTGSIRVNLGENKKKSERVVIYARVSSNKQREDLDRQVSRLLAYTTAKGYNVDKIVKEVASGVNDNRKRLNSILNDPTVTMVVVENRDRLTRFGFNYIETLLRNNGATIEVVNNVDPDRDDLIADMISVIYSFSARMYSRRRAKNIANCVKDNLNEPS